MEENLHQSKIIIFMKRILPSIIRIINTIFYTVLNFIKNSIKYALDQIKN